MKPSTTVTGQRLRISDILGCATCFRVHSDRGPVNGSSHVLLRNDSSRVRVVAVDDRGGCVMVKMGDSSSQIKGLLSHRSRVKVVRGM